MRPIGTIAIGLALVSGAPIAQAQTAVTRQITSEPVETVVTTGPNGTAVTRRILSPDPGVTTLAAPLPIYPPVAVEAYEPRYVEPVAPAPRRLTTGRATTVGLSTRTPERATTVGIGTRAPERVRTQTTRRVVERPARTVARTVVVPPPGQALVLTPAQRQVIYRTVVQREYDPAPVPLLPPVMARPPVVVQTDIYAPPSAAGYPPRTVYPADEGYRDYAYDPYHDDYREPYRATYRWDGAPLLVGARIPQSVPLYAVPEPVAIRIPAARPYSYAMIENRVYLVDPATNVIVAEIKP